MILSSPDTTLTDAEPPAATPTDGPVARGRARAWLRRRGVTTEWLILSLLVASATLSAVSFYQATSFSESSTDALNQSRFAAAAQADADSALEAQVTHDRNVLLTCGLAIQQRNEALRTYSRSFEPAASQAMVDAEQTRIAIQALLIADSVGFCPGYSVDSAVQLALAGQGELIATARDEDDPLPPGPAGFAFYNLHGWEGDLEARFEQVRMWVR